jgi:hypothetical protein
MENESPTKSPSTSLPNAWIDRIFSRLALAYGSKFADMWKGQDMESVRAMWGQELAHLTGQELALAFQSLRRLHPTRRRRCMNSWICAGRRRHR